MIKKATLLIVNINKLYMMKEMDQHDDYILHHAFLAIHHDIIIAMGEGDFHPYIDKDTRMIDGSNKIAVPGFIDCDAGCYPILPSYMSNLQLKDMRLNDILLHTQEMLYMMMKHGVTTWNFQRINEEMRSSIKILEKDYRFEITEIPIHNFKISNIETSYDTFSFSCISCQYHPIKRANLNPIFIGQILSMLHDVDSLEILDALTRKPAQLLNLSHIGCLAEGKQADIVLLQGYDIHDIFSKNIDEPVVAIIKKGVMIYPKLLI